MVTCVEECSRQTGIMIHYIQNFLNLLMPVLTKDFIKVNIKFEVNFFFHEL